MPFRIPLACLLACSATLAAPPQHFTIAQIMSAPFPTDLVAAPKGDAVAWVLNQKGARNIWVAEAPAYKGRQLTNYRDDDGQEIAQLAWTPDARSIVFVRGGDFETHRDNPNPASLPQGVEQDIWIVPARPSKAPRKIAEGSEPAMSPKGDRIVFLHKNEIWSAALAENAKPEQLIHARGDAGELRWSPDGSKLAFVSSRTGHSFIGVYDANAKSLLYLDPSVDRDSSRGLDGKRNRLHSRGRFHASRLLWTAPQRAALVDPSRRRRQWEGPRTLARRARSLRCTFHHGRRQPVVLGRRRPHRLPLGKDRLPASLFSLHTRRYAHAAQHRRPIRDRAPIAGERWQDSALLVEPERYRPPSSLARLGSGRRPNAGNSRRRPGVVTRRDE